MAVYNPSHPFNNYINFKFEMKIDLRVLIVSSSKFIISPPAYYEAIIYAINRVQNIIFYFSKNIQYLRTPDYKN